MSFELSADIERRLRQAALSQGQDVEAFVRDTILRQLESVETLNGRDREELLRQEFSEAMRDVAFVSDMDETMHDFARVDAETARMISHG